MSGSDVKRRRADGEELDEYEEDVIDEVLPSDEELQSQVKKIHMSVSQQTLLSSGLHLRHSYNQLRVALALNTIFLLS